MEVKVLTKGAKGLYSKSYWEKGQIVARVTGEQFEEPNRYTIQIAPGVHIDPDNFLRYMNHSCNANVVVRATEVVALKNILPGDEITFDYNSTEDRLAEPFTCWCCGKEIRGRLVGH